MPLTLNELPIRDAARRLTALPRKAKFITDIAEPKRATLLSDTEDAKCAKLITESFKQLPVAVMPTTESVECRRT
jgi:hypothetical protein